jgi:hypothetical protein
MMQVCTVVSGNTAPIASGKPPAFARACLEPVDDGDQDVVDAPGLELVHHLQPELGALGLLDPQPEHLLLAFAVEGERDIDGFVADQAFVADLDPQRVEKDHRIDRVERPVLPFPNLLEDGVGDPADQIGGNLNPVKLLQVSLDLANREAPGIEADDPIVEPMEPGLPFGDDLRLKAAIAVARHRDLDRSVIADHGLARIPVAAVAAAAAGRVALLVSQMLAQFGAERPFQQALLKFLEQTLLAEQILRRAVALQQLLDEFVPDRLCHYP